MIREESLSTLPAIRQSVSNNRLSFKLGVEEIESFNDSLKSLLSSEEEDLYARFTVEKKKREWLAGRVLTKYLIRAYLCDPIPYHDITILNGEKRCPYVMMSGGWEEMGLPKLIVSISHRERYVFCGVAEEKSVAGLGVDVELIEERAESFLTDYFTPKERDYVKNSKQPVRDTTAIWSLKEAALKALKVGLTIPAQDVEVDLNDYTITVIKSGQKIQGSLSYHEPYIFSTAVTT